MADLSAEHCGRVGPWQTVEFGFKRPGSGSTLAAVSGDWRIGRVELLRSLITQAEPDVVEEVKWRKPSNPDGVPAFSLDGLICTVETYKDKVKVTMARGAALTDPAGLFNASLDAGTRRAIDLRQGDELDEQAFVALVREAIDL